jgi:hypothetical protein
MSGELRRVTAVVNVYDVRIWRWTDASRWISGIDAFHWAINVLEDRIRSFSFSRTELIGDRQYLE